MSETHIVYTMSFPGFRGKFFLITLHALIFEGRTDLMHQDCNYIFCVLFNIAYDKVLFLVNVFFRVDRVVCVLDRFV